MAASKARCSPEKLQQGLHRLRLLHLHRQPGPAFGQLQNFFQSGDGLALAGVQPLELR